MKTDLVPVADPADEARPPRPTDRDDLCAARGLRRAIGLSRSAARAGSGAPFPAIAAAAPHRTPPEPAESGPSRSARVSDRTRNRPSRRFDEADVTARDPKPTRGGDFTAPPPAAPRLAGATIRAAVPACRGCNCAGHNDLDELLRLAVGDPGARALEVQDSRAVLVKPELTKTGATPYPIVGTFDVE